VIPSLPPTYVDHLVSPRGLGDLPAAQAAGQQGSMVGGMGVRVMLTWGEGADGGAVVRDAAVRVLGSAAPIAPASVLSGLAPGRTTDEAAGLEPRDLLAPLLGGSVDTLPRAVHKGAAFVIEALRCALGLPHCRPSDPQGQGILVCRCLDVGDRAIHEAIRRGANTPEAVGDRCGAGTGCRSCRPDVLVLIHEALNAPPPTPSFDLHPVARIALARVGPALAAHGLPLCDARVTDDRVDLVAGTPTPDASISARGALGIARYVLRETVCESLDVRVT
jgi:bacterioferritin-associated ferredoxin/NifU-like protein involved in Fe-S cluster formation